MKAVDRNVSLVPSALGIKRVSVTNARILALALAVRAQIVTSSITFLCAPARMTIPEIRSFCANQSRKVGLLASIFAIINRR